MRITPALLCFSLLFSAAPAADPAPQSATDTYLAARDRYIAEFKAHPSAEMADKREDKALTDLARLLKLAVPEWKSPDFPLPGESNIDTLSGKGAIGFGLLDGLRYGAGDTSVVVTSRLLLERWLADHREWWKGEGKIPSSPSVAFRTEAFWTQAIYNEVTANLHGMVLVKAPAGAELAMVQLVLFSQDTALDAGPDMLVAAVVRGERRFVAAQKLKTSLAKSAYCEKLMQQTLSRAKAEKDPGKSDALEEKADREYRACFAQHLREQPSYAAIQKQAQALVDLLR